MAWFGYEISIWWSRLGDFLFRSGKCPYCKKWVRKVLYTCPCCRADLSQHWTEYKQMEDRMRENSAGNYGSNFKMGQNNKCKFPGDSFIGKHIKRTNRNLLLTNIGIIVGILFLWGNNAFSEAGYWALFIFALIILACWNIVRFWKRNKNQFLHPISIALAKIGPPEKVAAMINEESKVPKVGIKSVIITNSWLFKSSIYGLEITLLGELVWVYNKVTTHYTNGIRTGESHSVAIYKRDGKSFEVCCDQLAASILMKRVTEIAPWVVGGYNEKIKKFWDTDKQGFIAYVDQRKKERNTRMVNSQNNHKE